MVPSARVSKSEGGKQENKPERNGTNGIFNNETCQKTIINR